MDWRGEADSADPATARNRASRKCQYGTGGDAGRDAVLLNSDTLVARAGLEDLRSAAYSAPDIGTARRCPTMRPS